MVGDPSPVTIGVPDETRERTALKEWAVLADAMARGEIVALVRKGGIRERRAGFSVRHERFVIYPTYFHETPDELAPRFRERLTSGSRPPRPGIVEVALVARVRAVWRVTDLERLRTVDGVHGLAWSAVESRFRYRDDPQVHLVAVEVARLPAVITIPEQRRYLGCVSWVELDEAVDVSTATPVLNSGELEAHLGALREALGDPSG